MTKSDREIMEIFEAYDLPPRRIAVIVLAVLRHDQRLADMAGGNNVSESTVRCWRDELITLLSAQAPRLDRALKKVAQQGGRWS
ncbi:hypothetical protein ACFWIJ_07720 [Streptomyces sp. NPDC127079]|uniref:hypothetical protein n=1 Tax=Streptomyces sp. NPDC127079 TaxID=3347132 RepID=UPI0036587B7E